MKQGLKLSAIIDKLDLKITDPKADTNKVGADMMMQIISKAHKAEQEIYAFVAETKGITPQEAEKVDLVQFIKDMASDTGVMNFFKSAVK
jgi:predicted peroxiredoxin